MSQPSRTESQSSRRRLSFPCRGCRALCALTGAGFAGSPLSPLSRRFSANVRVPYALSRVGSGLAGRCPDSSDQGASRSPGCSGQHGPRHVARPVQAIAADWPGWHGNGLPGRAAPSGSAPSGPQAHPARPGLTPSYRSLRSRAAGVGIDGPPQHRQGVRRRYHPESEIRNPKSEIRNPKSEIRNPKSEQTRVLRISILVLRDLREVGPTS